MSKKLKKLSQIFGEGGSWTTVKSVVYYLDNDERSVVRVGQCFTLQVFENWHTTSCYGNASLGYFEKNNVKVFCGIVNLKVTSIENISGSYGFCLRLVNSGNQVDGIPDYLDYTANQMMDLIASLRDRLPVWHPPVDRETASDESICYLCLHDEIADNEKSFFPCAHFLCIDPCMEDAFQNTNVAYGVRQQLTIGNVALNVNKCIEVVKLVKCAACAVSFHAMKPRGESFGSDAFPFASDDFLEAIKLRESEHAGNCVRFYPLDLFVEIDS